MLRNYKNHKRFTVDSWTLAPFCLPKFMHALNLICFARVHIPNLRYNAGQDGDGRAAVSPATDCHVESNVIRHDNIICHNVRVHIIIIWSGSQCFIYF